MRKRSIMMALCAVTVFVTGCASGGGSGASSRPSPNAPAPLTGSTAGAASALQSVEVFMKAVKAQDLQTMSAVWGTSRGPAREQMDREQLEKRLIIIQCKLDHDNWSFAEDRPRLMTGGKQDFRVRLKQRQAEAVTSFTTILGPENRWFVEIVDMEPLRDFCA